LIVHHCGKDEARGMRGHTALLGALDAEIAIDTAQQGGQAHERILRTGKVRDGDGDTDLFVFTLRSVELGIDSDGDPVRTCVVEAREDAELTKARRNTRTLGRNQKTVVNILADSTGMTRADLIKIMVEEHGMGRQRAHHTITEMIDGGLLANPMGVITLV